MQGTKVMKAVFLAIQSSNPQSMVESAKAVSESIGCDVWVNVYEYSALNEDPLLYDDLLRRSKEADFIYIRVMSDPTRFKRFNDYVSIVKNTSALIFLYSGNIDVTTMNRELFRADDADFKSFVVYAAHRGPHNDQGMLWMAAKHLGLTDLQPPDPQDPRDNGIYHPDFPRDVSQEEYMAHIRGDRITVGLMFGGYLWNYSNLAHVDAIIRSLEAHGMDVIPFFTNAFNKGIENGKKNEFDKYFVSDDGRVLIDVLITLSSFSHMTKLNEGHEDNPDYNYFRDELNVPILFGLTVNGPYHDFEDDKQGLAASDMKSNVIYPELDGDIITVPVAFTPRSGGTKRSYPIPDRIEHLSRLAYGWGNLRHKPVSERKVAILMWQSSANSGNIGAAAGLDSMESISDILKRMSANGYRVEGVPESGKDLVDQILSKVTNDVDSYPIEFVRDNAAALVDKKVYEPQFRRIPEWDQGMTVKDWGEPPGDIHVDSGKLIIPGLIKGNVFVSYQPLRGRAEKMAEDYHDPVLFAQHQYLGFYRWIQEDFGADLIINVGTHGSLEWLPGKNVGMSNKCEPDIVNAGVPNLYIYIIDDPGEGIQCKRRIESVLVGHMTPSMARAESYKEIDEVNVHLQDYFKSRIGASEERMAVIISQIYEAAKENNLLKDLGIEDDNDPGPEGFGPYIIPLHDYLVELKDALIRSDLHVLGRVPEGRHFDDMVYSLLRLDNGKISSLRDAFALNQGVDMQKALEDPSGTIIEGEVNAVTIDRIDAELMDFLEHCRGCGFDEETVKEYIVDRYGSISDPLNETIEYMCRRVVPNILRMGDEIDHLFDGTNGEYILPGPSGAPTRGNADLLPMGRNFYGIDPGGIPSESSWEIGKRMADQMIERYIQDKGTFPREVGFIIWATDTMKTGGDDVAYILWLMGIRPVWSSTGGQVTGLEVVPLEELGRPRVDVTINITGLFRDTFPNLIDLIDDAVKMVAGLDEDDDDNCLLANLRRDMIEDMANGMSPDEARQKNCVRMFGAPLGGYGAGVGQAIASGQWETVEDLANVWMDWCSNGYEKGNFGVKMKNQFIRRFSKVTVTVKNMPDREIDLLDCDDVYEFLGGMNAFVRAYGQKDAVTYVGDGSNPKNTKIRSTKEELRFVVRSKALNPKFINGLKEHGYRGAAELANIVEYTMAWGATSDVAEDWMYEGLADKYIMDDDIREWMKDVNPYAAMNILDRLSEAVDRGLWDAPEEYLEKIKELYMEIEERIEELTDR